jgi:hypothetical protein
MSSGTRVPALQEAFELRINLRFMRAAIKVVSCCRAVSYITSA